MHLRDPQDTPPTSLTIVSPYDPEARFSRKRDTSWAGYRVYLTETCDAGKPKLITHVETRPAPEQDATTIEDIHQAAFTLGVRRARYRGSPKVHFHHLTTAAAINLRRTIDWLLGGPTATTRKTHFVALAPA